MSRLFFINLDREVDERFDISKFMEFTDNYDCLTSDLLNEIKSLPFGGNYKISRDAGRPDKAALNIYNAFEYWWILLFYNDMLDVDEFSSGLVIQYPRREALEDYYFSLRVRQLRND